MFYLRHDKTSRAMRNDDRFAFDRENRHRDERRYVIASAEARAQ